MGVSRSSTDSVRRGPDHCRTVPLLEAAVQVVQVTRPTHLHITFQNDIGGWWWRWHEKRIERIFMSFKGSNDNENIWRENDIGRILRWLLIARKEVVMAFKGALTAFKKGLLVTFLIQCQQMSAYWVHYGSKVWRCRWCQSGSGGVVYRVLPTPPPPITSSLDNSHGSQQQYNGYVWYFSHS